jgi:two-component system, OmpR family, phosphate regulon sensor histidine kinase PhoR
MRKALIVRFLSVLMFALIMSSTVAYYFYAENMLKSNVNSMRTVIQAVDFGIDYSADLQEQVQQLAKNTDKDTVQNKLRITVIDLGWNSPC